MSFFCEYQEKDAKGVTYRLYLEQDDTPVRGNALASGDDTADRECEDEILARLANGDIWAWAVVRCEASFDDFTGEDYLGGCSYKDTQDFIQRGYWDDMKAQAYQTLLANLRKAVNHATNHATKVETILRRLTA